MEENYPHREPSGSFKSPLINTQDSSRPDAARSPWSFSSQNSCDHLSLTLPSTLTPGDIAEHPAFYDRFSSPSDFLLDRPSNSHSRTLGSRPDARQNIDSPPYSQTHVETFGDTLYPDPFTDPFHSSPQQLPQEDLIGDSGVVDLTDSSPHTMDSRNAKRKAVDGNSQSSSKRRRPSVKVKKDEVDSEIQPGFEPDKAVEEVDLVGIDDDHSYGAYQSQRQEELIKQQRQDEADKPIKLSEFQCIICLDNPTDLTVTWCGHLFCSVCLHEALHAGTQKKACPVCRQTINTKPGGKSKLGVFPLSMKLMTAKKKGKQPVARV